MSKCVSEKKNPRRYFYSNRKSAYSQSKKAKQKETVIFMIVDDGFMGMHLPYSLSNESIRRTIREAGGFWCQNFKIWKLPKESYTQVRTEIPRLITNGIIQDLPRFIEKALQSISEKLYVEILNKTLLYDPLDRHKNVQDNILYPKLYDFQKITVQLAIKNYGRLLIADEMGVGKSIQGLACALMYMNEWPLLIICPSSLKVVWKQQIKKWLHKTIKKEEVQIIQKYGVPINHQVAKIVIFSYEIAAKSTQKLSRFKVVIADEAHYLKNTDAIRTQQLLPFLCGRKRIFLLTGTPALAKPRQTFNLIQIIRPDIYSGIKQFGDRYCFKEMNRWTMKMEYDGSRNIAELHYLLKDRIMIRRLKHEVLEELPPKQRQVITIQAQKNIVRQIKSLLNTQDVPLDILRNSEKLIKTGIEEQNQTMSPLNKCYYLSGLAKLEGVKSYISSILDNDVKILIFAHHQNMMNQIQHHVKSLKVEYIRIDGNTPNQTRLKNIKRFQEEYLIRVAILSITAAGIGITLTAASTVIFAQLHWTPAILAQAQDRAHRIGQKDSVNVHYLIGQNTLDHLLWRQLERKLQTTGNILDGQMGNINALKIQKGQIGQANSIGEEPKTEQKSILSFIQRGRVSKVKQEEKDIEIEPEKRKLVMVESDIDQDSIPEHQLQKLIKEKELEIREKRKKVSQKKLLL